MKPGIYEKIPFSDYLKIDAFSKSMVGPILKSPKHLKYEQEQGVEPSAGMDFGSLVDCLLLEPAVFDSRFVILPDTCQDAKGKTINFTRQAKDGKEIIARIIAVGRIPIGKPEVKRANNIVAEIKKHPTAAAILEGCKTQVTVIWTDPETGILCKGRFDIFKPDRFADLKVTDNPHPGAFSKVAGNLKYHVQAAIYHDGFFCATEGAYPQEWKIPFSFIAAEAGPPHDVVTYDMQEESLDAGRVIYRDALQKYADCKAVNQWPGYSDFAEPLDIPQWLRHRILFEGVNDE